MARSLLLIALSVLAAAASNAATAATVPARCTASEYHQLDFWVDDWDTFDTESPGGPSVARAHVDRIAQGCGLHELYEQDDGLIGDSILSYDAVRKQWQQTWLTNGGSLMVITGNVQDGKLVLEGEVHRGNGETFLQRISWQAQGDGVREWASFSKDQGKTWNPAFDVLFRKHQASR